MQSPTQSFRVQRGFNEQRAEIDARKKKLKYCHKSHINDQCLFVKELPCHIHGRAVQKHLLQIILAKARFEQIQKNRSCSGYSACVTCYHEEIMRNMRNLLVLTVI